MPMMWILDRLKSGAERDAFVLPARTVSYAQLADDVERRLDELTQAGIGRGSVVAVIGDYSPSSAALILALLMRNAVVVPLTAETSAKHSVFFALAGVAHIFECQTETGQYLHSKIAGETPTLVDKLQREEGAGFVLFTSGTSGVSKGVVLSAQRLLKRFESGPLDTGRISRCLVFLKLDHIGGLNTLFNILFAGGTAVSIEDRSVDRVCQCIENNRIELLPTTPTFLNMLLLSRAYEQYDLSSLKVITYGTEPMPGSTLVAAHKAFPKVKLKQTYGLTELGIFSTKSRSSGSEWMMVGGKGVQTKIENGVLFIKTDAAMLGYLNAPSPFTEDGWYNTGDRVEVDGEYLKVLGRESEIINVGGEKVYPAEVESVLLEMPSVKDVLVRGQPNPVTGNIVTASFLLETAEERVALYRRMVAFCKDRLEPFKVPKLVTVSESGFMSDRMKKARSQPAA